MVSRELAQAVDEGIKDAQQSLKELPAELRTRIVSLRAMPNEVISRIKQINGLVVEFEERI